MHERYLALPEDKAEADRWRNWDHWLDQHVGIKYAGSSDAEALAGSVSDLDALKDELQATCLTMAKEVNEVLLDEKVWTGKRSILTDGDHYYTATAGNSLALEFNTECHYGEMGATDICTCVAENSDNLALEKYGAKFSTCGTIYEEEDGHADTKGPWTAEGWARDTEDNTGADKPNADALADTDDDAALSNDDNGYPDSSADGEGGKAEDDAGNGIDDAAAAAEASGNNGAK